MGRLLGIARHARPRGPMETLEEADVTVAMGVPGDCRGPLKPRSRNRRQVTVMAVEDWHAALDDLGVRIPWKERRVNMMVEGIPLEETAGAHIIFESGLVLEVTGECDPCTRMEDVAPGLEGALRPNWRGGVTARVIEGSLIRVGEQVRIKR